jgi:methylmalonyl-CoA epimerase
MEIKANKIDHIGIAVENLDEALGFYEDILGLEFTGTEEIPDQKVRTAFFRIGEVNIELLEPTSTDSPIRKFLDGGKKGIHHLAFEVFDLESALETLQNRGVELIDKTPRIGAHNKKIAFLHPRAANSVLIELCQSGDPQE